MSASLAHLTGRFFDFLTARPLSGDQGLSVRGWLTESQQQVFFEQDPRDQSHGYHAATVVTSSRFFEIEVIRAALLHDVGKRHAALGLIGRSLASILIKLNLPMTFRMRLYRDHGVAGADELMGLGSSPLVVEFARHHHGDRPDSIGETVWAILQQADRPTKPSVLR